MTSYDIPGWPRDGVLMVKPFDPALHAEGSRSREGRCLWSDHDMPASWSAVWNGSRWAVCDQDLLRLLRCEMGLEDGPPDRPAPDT